jgi:hypothetical protein
VLEVIGLFNFLADWAAAQPASPTPAGSVTPATPSTPPRLPDAFAMRLKLYQQCVVDGQDTCSQPVNLESEAQGLVSLPGVELLNGQRYMTRYASSLCTSASQALHAPSTPVCMPATAACALTTVLRF